MREVWAFDSQDFRNGAGGFEGRYTHLAGITGKDFESEAQAIARMEAKVTKTRAWRYIGEMSGFPHVWRKADIPFGQAEQWFICLRKEWR